jgi:hypothetical protein
MGRPANISKSTNLRVLLFTVTLFSLCVSNNVGLSFLPLPVVAERLAEISDSAHGESGSRLPSSREIDSFRVPIMGHKQKRVTKQPTPQPVAALQKTGIELPELARVASEVAVPVSISTFASISRPPGRAPPRSV